MLRMAVCGLGNIGAVHLANLASLRGCRISGVFDLRSEVTSQFADRYRTRAFASFDEMSGDDDTDAVVVATPTSSHCELSERVLAAGKHLFLEKPLAGSLDEGAVIVEASRTSSLCAQAGFCERFNPQFLEARQALRDGRLGLVRSIHSSRIAPLAFGDPSWELGVLDTAVHNFDLICWLKGCLPRTVQSWATQIYPEPAMNHEVVTVMRFADGSLATDRILWLDDGAHPLHLCARARMSITGDEGELEIDLSDRPAALLTKTSYRMLDTVILGGPQYYGCLKLQFEGFMRSIEEGTPVVAPLADALTAEQVAIAAKQSLESGCAVELPLWK